MKGDQCCGAEHGGARKDYSRCNCELTREHEGDHRCACGGEWSRGGLTVTPPAYPAIAGWS